MKKTALATILMSVLLASGGTGAFVVRLGKANPTPVPLIELTMSDATNQTYTTNTISLGFRAREFVIRSGVNFFYILDKEKRTPISNFTVVSDEMVPYNPQFSIMTMSGNFQLSNLSEGWHKATVYCQTYDQNYDDKGSIDFLVDTVPVISFLSFENRTFASPYIPIIFTVNQPTSQIKYCLDGLENLTISENATLNGLANGEHNLTIYATDESGNTGVSETIYLNVDVPETFPTTLLIGSAIPVAVVGLGLLVYFKKRRNL
jgi:hypothetical protein